MFNYQLFVNKFLENQLNNIDTIIYPNDIYNILCQIQNIQKEKFILPEIINRLIISTSNTLPLICCSIIQVYSFNQEICYQAFYDIYKQFLYKKNNKLLVHQFINSILYYLRIISPISYNQLNQYVHIPYSYFINKKYKLYDIKKILIFLIKLYWQQSNTSKKNIIFLNALLIIYTQYNSILNHHQQKVFINLLIKIMIDMFYTLKISCPQQIKKIYIDFFDQYIDIINFQYIKIYKNI